MHIHTGDTVYCLGDHSCYRAHIHGARNIVCGGGGSCISATVHSNGSDVNIYALGELGAYVLRVYCDAGDKCLIHCGGNEACEGVHMYCEATGDCSFECAGEEFDCPEVTTPGPTRARTASPTPAPSSPSPTLKLSAVAESKCGRIGVQATGVCTKVHQQIT